MPKRKTWAPAAGETPPKRKGLPASQLEVTHTVLDCDRPRKESLVDEVPSMDTQQCADIREMKTCECGKALSLHDKFCPDCGKKAVETKPDVRTKKKVNCPGKIQGLPCNAEVDDRFNFCLECGCQLPRSLFQEIEVVPIVCSNTGPDGKICNTQLPPGAKFCFTCGSLQPATQIQVEKADAVKPVLTNATASDPGTSTLANLSSATDTQLGSPFTDCAGATRTSGKETDNSEPAIQHGPGPGSSPDGALTRSVTESQPVDQNPSQTQSLLQPDKETERKVLDSQTEQYDTTKGVVGDAQTSPALHDTSSQDTDTRLKSHLTDSGHRIDPASEEPPKQAAGPNANIKQTLSEDVPDAVVFRSKQSISLSTETSDVEGKSGSGHQQTVTKTDPLCSEIDLGDIDVQLKKDDKTEKVTFVSSAVVDVSHQMHPQSAGLVDQHDNKLRGDTAGHLQQAQVENEATPIAGTQQFVGTSCVNGSSVDSLVPKANAMSEGVEQKHMELLESKLQGEDCSQEANPDNSLPRNDAEKLLPDEKASHAEEMSQKGSDSESEDSENEPASSAIGAGDSGEKRKSKKAKNQQKKKAKKAEQREKKNMKLFKSPAEKFPEPSDSTEPTGKTAKAHKSATSKTKEAGHFTERQASYEKNPVTNSTYEHAVMVHFHVLFSPLMEFNVKEETASMRFDKGRLGGWNASTDRITLTVEKDLNGFLQMVGNISIPRSLTRTRIEYKYMIHSNDGSIRWEGVVNGYTHDRVFKIPENYKNDDEWHQYDGVSYPENATNPGWLQKFASWFQGKPRSKDVYQHGIDMTIDAFSVRIDDMVHQGSTGMEICEKVQRVYSCLRETCLDRNHTVDEGMFGLHVKNWMEHQWNRFAVKDADVEMKVIMGVISLWMVKEYKMGYSYDCWQKIDNCLMMYPTRVGQKNECTVWNIFEKHFSGLKRQIFDALLFVCKWFAKSSDSWDFNWLKLVPWLHFLNKDAAPWGLCVKGSHNEYTPKWWGTHLFREECEHLKEKLFRNESMDGALQDIILELAPLFQLDPLLPRTIMAIVSPRHLSVIIHLEMFPTDVIMATLFYYVKAINGFDRRFSGSTDKWNRECKDAISNLVRVVLKLSYKEEQNIDIEKYTALEMNALSMVEISRDLFDLTLSYSSVGHRFKAVVFQLRILVLDLLAQLHGLLPPDADPKMRQDNEKMDENLFKTYCSGSIRYLQSLDRNYNITIQENLQLRNALFGVKFQCKWLENKWHEVLVNNLNEGLLKANNTKILDYYCDLVTDLNSLHHILAECLNQGAFMQLEKETARLHDLYGARRDLTKFGPLLSRLLEKSWPKNTGNTSAILTHILHWSAFPFFLQFYGTETMKVLDAGCAKKLACAVSLLEDLSKNIKNGVIEVRKFWLVIENIDKLKELLHIIAKRDNLERKHCSSETGCALKPDCVLKAVGYRQAELQAYEDKRRKISDFLKLCKRITPAVSTDALKRKCQIEIDQCKFDDICDPKQVHTAEDPSYQPVITLFDVTPGLEAVLEKMHLQESEVFVKLWEAYGKTASSSATPLNIEDAITKIFQPAETHWLNLQKKLLDGSLSFKEVDDHFGTDKFKEARLGEEFVHFNNGQRDSVIDERLAQVKLYHDLKLHIRSANIILDLKKALQLTGKFEEMEVIISSGVDSPRSCLKSMDKSMRKVTETLRGLRPERQKCLFDFSKCTALVGWLAKEIHSQKELKVFVDLASISAGEGDMEIEKVSMLHSATTGYSPLLFDLPKNISCKDFLKKCSEVWKALDADPSLPEKLLDLNRNLEWLETVKASHGSVEVSSLSQAEAINNKGLYKIGSIVKFKNQSKSLNSTIQLTIPGATNEERGTETKVYSYSQLHDLQSRLMLVAGQAEKGNEEVNRFTEVLDSVTRLANAYIKLCRSGNVLFYNMSVLLYNQSKKVMVDFGQDSLRLNRTSDDLNEEVINLAKFMETCLDDWLNYYRKQRSKHFPLNHFTIEQLVILQGELVKVNKTTDLPNKVYPLLSSIKPNCNKRDLLLAMDNALKKVNELEAATCRPANYLDSERAKFVAAIQEGGYSKNHALKALEAKINPADPAAGLMWCLENSGSDSESDEEDSEGNITRQRCNFQGWSQNKSSLETVTEEALCSVTGDNPLHERLGQVWRNFLAAVSGSLSNYMSVEHLGIVLSELANLAPEETPQQSFPPVFKTGVPNLLICPQADILGVTLSIYTSGGNEDSLPTTSEVLLCTQETTLDQVDIFWRRAIFDPSRKIYCLVNADKLDYDVSDKAERRLELYMEEPSKAEEYRLVVLCSSEGEQRSRIVTALEKYRRPMCAMQNALSKCLETKLQNPDPQAASSLDFTQCTVRVIRSSRAGVGKSLYKKRLVEKLEKSFYRTRRKSVHSIPLHGKAVDVSRVVDQLLDHTLAPGQKFPRIIHFDVAYEIQEGVDDLLFNLLILGAIQDSKGYIWRKSDLDLYLVETMPLMILESGQQATRCAHSTLNILPSVMCRSPQESLDLLYDNPTGYTGTDRLFDEQEFKSAIFQRPYQYLRRVDSADFQNVNPNTTEGNIIDCLEVLLRHCGIPDPSWTELRHFVWFLNVQLRDCESSVFCGAAAAGDLPGFLKFVVRFMIKMSRDFATRSLVISEETPTLCQRPETEDDEQDLLARYQMRRTWESSPHPYIFFNPDHNSMTFLGFNIVGEAGDMVDPLTGQVLEAAIMPGQLKQALNRNKVPLTENFDSLPRDQKLVKLCRVMGIEDMYDPDVTYELTTDNVKKMLAIYMRFRCGIPVIVMGETGCGKTRLVKFLCSLQKPPELEEVPNMVLMKVHGGTTETDITRKVLEAQEKAKENCETYGSNMFTVLFFDEANTTEAIGLIKEVMCDGSMNGEPLQFNTNLKIVAACNPYRKHSDEMIKRLERAGLGYHVEAEKTVDRLGCVPMRRLVYRVQALPQSLLPLVWDFGQLDTNVEKMYIHQMVQNCFKQEMFEDDPSINSSLITSVTTILAESQNFMRGLNNECSFVSLRDVERTLKVVCWFYEQGEQADLFQTIQDKLTEDKEEDSSDNDMPDSEQEDAESLSEQPDRDLDDIVLSLVLAVGTCYHACLSNESRVNYRKHMEAFFKPISSDKLDAEMLLKHITSCQDAFLDEMKIGENIAKNQALKENVFMMVVAIELRLPLFLVGKPGSSKSLAKTIVADAMQGNAAHGELFKQFKQVQMVSFQCSPISTADGIVGTFRQCSQFQKDKNLDQFVSVVVLDEIGLAEDSTKMPLKTLHPLLEDGCQGDEKPEAHRKVAFIGISNWALDPAKMNRGVFVQREVPDEEELKHSAEGICSTDDRVRSKIKPYVPALSSAYLELFQEATKRRREFYGLRDFYSLLKMLYGFVKRSDKEPSWFELEHAIKRNFGGLHGMEAVDYFKEHLADLVKIKTKRRRDDLDCSAAGLIRACLFNTNTGSESRYLLLLTENYGALTILQQQILTQTSCGRAPITIFGSSFPKDQEYTQICRNINRIKICMETGNTVILLNLENLYESLYDALNQYYVYLGGERFVDLGLGTHRVKCRVHKDFRLVVVAEKEVVYNKFPIPLINRMEKHFLTVSTILNEEQLALAEELQDWTGEFISAQGFRQLRSAMKKTVPGDAFVGYHADTAASVILHEWTKLCDGSEDVEHLPEKVLESAKKTLLWSATPDAVCRLKNSKLASEADHIAEIYFHEQKHESLQEYLSWKIVTQRSVASLIQVTTHSKLLSTRDMKDLSRELQIPRECITLLSLQSFDTEQQFCRQLRKFLGTCTDENPRLLIVQCDSGDQNGSLVASARYSTMDEVSQHAENVTGEFNIVLIVQLPQIAGGCFSGFQIGKWQSVHIDELRPVDEKLPNTVKLFERTIGELLQKPGQYNTYKQAMPRPEEDTEAEPMDVDTENPEAMMAHAGASSMEWQSEETQDTWNAGSREPVLDTMVFIHKCLQAAAAMIKDDDDKDNRTITRVQLLFDLLDHSSAGELHFREVVGKRLVELLKIREDRMTSVELARTWLCEDAARPDIISRAGTFRRSWMHVIENKVTPLLAGIIAFMDTNNNLDLLSAGEDCAWKRQLWLALFNDREATPLDYQELLSPTKKIELKEIYSRLFGFGVTLSCPQLPFSWIIINKVQQLLKGSEEIKDNDTIARLVADTGIGRALNSVTMAEDKQELLRCYISDFIAIIHTTSNKAEHELICQSVEGVVSGQGAEDGIIVALVMVHAVYKDLQGHLQNFSSLNRAWPGCADKVRDFQDSQPDHFMNNSSEFLLDILAAGQLLETLQPNGSEIDKVKGKKAWLDKVLSVKPAIERVCLSEAEPGDREMRSRRQEVLAEIRNLWNRVQVLRLFIEHVCPPEDKGAKKLKFIRCMALWELVGVDVNFKCLPSLEKVEKFLKSCNKGAINHYIGKLQRCAHCDEELNAVPMLLDCKHQVCVECVQTIVEVDQECPICHAEMPQGFKPKEATEDRKSLDAFLSYQQRCNSFFMALVSQLCFASDSPPDGPVIQKLLGFVTKEVRSGHHGYELRTKAMSVLDSCIDPTPVVRSFLLQLLLRVSSEADVIQHLEEFFQYAKRSCARNGVQDEDVAELVELSLLVTQCFEDSYRNKSCASQKVDLEEEVWFAVQLMKDARMQWRDSTLNMNTLCSIAKARYGLTVTAKCLHDVFVTQDGPMMPQTPLFRKIVESARTLSETCSMKWPRVFLMREICRSYGTDSFDVIRKKKLVDWILMGVNFDQQGSPDHYVVIGDEYRRLRELLTKVTLSEDVQQLSQFLQTSGADDSVVKTRLMLAIHREITMTETQTSQEAVTSTSQQVLEAIKKICLDSDIADRDMLNRLFDNQLGKSCQRLQASEDQSLRDQHIVCLVAHMMCVIRNMGDNRLLEPLFAIARNPRSMAACYLPTMPEDHMREVHEALLQGRATSNDNPVLYRCARGHPYVIGDCGRPAVLEVCKEPGCGSKIGGAGHNLTEGNTKVENAGQDLTMHGHVLGNPATRTKQPVPERKLNPASCSIVRLLTHLTMYIGANDHPQEMAGLIKPTVGNDIEEFLWGHMAVDFTVIQAALGKAFDDAVLLFHHLLDRIHNDNTHGTGPRFSLKDKVGRVNWEGQFNTTYVSPVLSRLEDVIDKLNQTVMNDDRIGNNALMRVLYEADAPQGEANLSNVLEVPAFWRYRSHISLGHLEQLFNQQENQGAGAQRDNQFALLQLFLKEDHALRAIQYLPSILKLQRLLIQKYQRRIDSSEASSMHHHHVLEDLDEHSKKEYNRLLLDVGQAWDCVKESIPSHAYPSPKGRVSVPREYCQQVLNRQSCLAMLLPSLRGQGLCAYALVHVLLQKQNDFLQKYYNIVGKEIASVDTITVYSASSLTGAHLIHYHPDRDILPLILANCNYSFAVGKGTQVQYDFVNFQHQLDSRFFQGKPLLKVEQVETVIFRTEVTNASIFKTLRDKIQQVSLWQGIQSQICGELRSVPDVCTALANVDISISFLVSAPRRPEDNLEEFMVNTLKMTQPLYSPQAKKHCLFKHVQALWLLLSLEKMKRLTHYGQDAFEGLDQAFQKALDEEQRNELKNYLKRLKGNKLDLFTEQLHDCLVLRIAVSQDNTAEDFVDTEQTRLRDMLLGHVDAPMYEDWATPGKQQPDLYLRDFPEGILCNQTVSVLQQALGHKKPPNY